MFWMMSNRQGNQVTFYDRLEVFARSSQLIRLDMKPSRNLFQKKKTLICCIVSFASFVFFLDLVAYFDTKGWTQSLPLALAESISGPSLQSKLALFFMLRQKNTELNSVDKWEKRPVLWVSISKPVFKHDPIRIRFVLYFLPSFLYISSPNTILYQRLHLTTKWHVPLSFGNFLPLNPSVHLLMLYMRTFTTEAEDSKLRQDEP